MVRTLTSGAQRTLGIIPVAGLYAVFIGIPMAFLLQSALFDTSQPGALWTTLKTPTYQVLLTRTVEIAAVTTLICLLVGFPFAFVLWRTSGARRLVLLGLVLFPFWTSVLVRAYGWQVLLQRGSGVSSLLIYLHIVPSSVVLSQSRVGLYIALVQIMLPYIVLPTLAILSRIDNLLLHAAATAGASPVRVVRTVVIPLALPGIATGAVVVFGIVASSFVIPVLLGGFGDAMLGQIVATQASEYLNWPLSGSLALMMMMVSLAGVLVIVMLGRLSGDLYRE